MSELMELYCAAEFVVRLFDGREWILEHATASPQLDAFLGLAHPETKTWAILTAWNPYSQPLSRSENDLRQQRLVIELARLGHPVYPAVGRAPAGAPPWSEDSLLVVGISREEAMALGARHEQHAVVVGVVGGRAWVEACPISD